MDDDADPVSRLRQGTEEASCSRWYGIYELRKSWIEIWGLRAFSR